MAFSMTVTKMEFLKGEYESNRDGDTAKVPYLIKCSEKPTSIDVIAGAAELPKKGDLFSNSSVLRCTRVSIKAENDYLTYSASAEYEVWTNDGTTGSDNPTEVKDTYSFEGSKESEEIFLGTVVGHEGDGAVPIVTTAGEPFNKQPIRTTGAFKLVIEGNRGSIDANAYASYLKPNAINSSAFTIRDLTISTGLGKMVNITATQAVANDVTYFKIKWEIELSATDWNITPDNRGFRMVDPADATKTVPIQQGTPKQPVNKPWPLALDGSARTLATDPPVNRTFIIYPSKDFNAFNWTAGA